MDGLKVTFELYFRNFCLEQIAELVTTSKIRLI